MIFIREILYRHREKLITGISLLLFIIAVINIYFVLVVRVNSNDECLWRPEKTGKDSTEIVFDLVKEGGVTWNAGIRNGDRLLAINGTNLNSTIQAQKILNSIKAGDYALYTVMNDETGKVFETNVYVKKIIQYPVLAAALLGLIWLIIGHIVMMSKPEGVVQKLFYGIGAAQILSITTAWIYPLFPGQDTVDSPVIQIAISYVSALCLNFLPFLLMYFFWIFPKPFRFVEKKIIKLLIVLIPGLLSIVTFVSLIMTFPFQVLNINYVNAVVNFLPILSVLANLVAYISLIISYRRLKEKKERKPVFLILVAYTIAMLASLYTAQVAPAITDLIYNNPEYYMPIILIIILPLTFGYAIFRYQLMDVSIVIRNTVIYGVATLTIAAIYFVTIYLLGQTISSAIGTEYQGVIAGAAFVIFAIVFQSTKDRFQDFLTARFYPEQFAHQKVLMGFSHEVSTVVGRENILHSLKETFVESLKLEKFGVLLRDEITGQFYLVRSKGLSSDELTVSSQNLDYYIESKNAISQRQVVEEHDFEIVFPEYAALLRREGIYTIVPMIIKTRVVGILLFGLKHSGAQFSGKDLDLLIAVANQAAVALENARLYESEAEKHKLERDLELARRIQQGLLPKCIPSMSGLQICGEMLPAMQVGGDYFDLIPVSDTKLFVVVGDVSGKGLSASLYMTRLQTMVQLACTFDKTPREILVDINRRMYSSMERNSFVTLTIALFDTEKRKAIYCRAGHMPLLIARNGTVSSYKTKGIGIGLDKGSIFESSLIEEEIDLTPGQFYAFFSDGVTEAMNEQEDLFGEDSLTELLKDKTSKTPSEVMDEIWSSIKTFRGTAQINDDMTMVLVKVVN